MTSNMKHQRFFMLYTHNGRKFMLCEKYVAQGLRRQNSSCYNVESYFNDYSFISFLMITNFD